MGDMQDVMKFELLPNEILLECFKYLNGTDIFYAFDFLNNRYYNLIRSIPLRLNFRHVQKSTFDQFCEQILSNPGIKNRIRSLHLSHETVYDQISTFLSRFSLDQFLHLRSLCLAVDYEGYARKDMKWAEEIDNIVTALSRSNIQSLSVPVLELNFAVLDPFTSVINLTISHSCSVSRVCLFFKYLPKLQYLSINYLKGCDWWKIDELNSTNEHTATHLKQLIVRGSPVYFGSFNSLETILRKTPNLSSLTISVENDLEILNPQDWQRLIESVLPRLTNFQFKFGMTYLRKDNDIYKRFEHFQNDFWYQNHWYTECALSKSCACIYTIPYPSNEYTLISYTERYCDVSNTDLGTFDKVTILTLSLQSITTTCEHYFSSVNSLTLDNDYERSIDTYPPLETKHIKSLKMIVNLYNLKQLDISSCLLDIESPLVLLLIMKEASNISSLKIRKDTLLSLFSNQDVCEYISKNITELDVLGDYFYDAYEIMKVCKRFSNIKRLKCYCDGPKHLLLVINELVKYSKMKVFSFNTHMPIQTKRWLQNQALEANIYSSKGNCDTYDDTSDSDIDFDECIYNSDGYYTDDYDIDDYEYYYYENDERLDFNVTDFRPGKQSLAFC
ncbi:hypothetical protein I4U23_011588 [Adineta vaga]|nr:hypothetical protein I4U23_011588 [Adineta vaga]